MNYCTNIWLQRFVHIVALHKGCNYVDSIAAAGCDDSSRGTLFVGNYSIRCNPSGKHKAAPPPSSSALQVSAHLCLLGAGRMWIIPPHTTLPRNSVVDIAMESAPCMC